MKVLYFGEQSVEIHTKPRHLSWVRVPVKMFCLVRKISTVGEWRQPTLVRSRRCTDKGYNFENPHEVFTVDWISLSSRLLLECLPSLLHTLRDLSQY